MTEPTWIEIIFEDAKPNPFLYVWIGMWFLMLSPLLLIGAFWNHKKQTFIVLESKYKERFDRAPSKKMRRHLKWKACKDFSLQEFKLYLNGL